MADEIELLRRFIDEIPGPSTDAWTRARAAIEAARSEEEPAAPRRRRRRGGKRRVLIAAAGAVAAAVTAFALVLAGSPPPGNSSQVVTTALVTRVEHAVASHQDDMIGYTRIVLRPGSRIQLGTGLMVGGSGVGSSLGVGVMVAWSYQGTTEISAFAPGGQRVFTAETASGGTGKPAQEVAVLYGDATWWRAMLPESNRQARTPPACGRGVVIGPGGWTAALIRSQLSCGSIQAGRQRDYQIGPIAPGRSWTEPTPSSSPRATALCCGLTLEHTCRSGSSPAEGSWPRSTFAGCLPATLVPARPRRPGGSGATALPAAPARCRLGR